MDVAQQLRSRAEDIARRLLPQIMERVFDKLAPDGMSVRIDHIEIDLGYIPAHALERDIPHALERALHDVLPEIVARARSGSSPDAQAVPTDMALLDDFERYLLHGTASGRYARGTFDPTGIVHRLLSEQAAGLARVLRRLAHRSNAITRLVWQSDHAALRAILGVLSPQDADIVVTYLDDLGSAYRHAAPITLPHPVFKNTVWIVTLTYMLNERGSQFNRRSFVSALLVGIARAEGIAYADLLDQLQSVLPLTRRRYAKTASLLTIIDDLSQTLAESVRHDVPLVGPQERAFPKQSNRDAGPTPHDDALRPPPLDSPEAWRAAEQFLRSGQPQLGGTYLGAMARANPQAFAAMLQRRLRANSGNATALMTHLLAWMLPGDIVDALPNARTRNATRWVEMLSDMPGETVASAWMRVLDAGLRGENLDAFDSRTNAATPLNRWTLLRLWMNGDSSPWWTHPDIGIDALLTGISDEPPAVLHALFDGASAEQIAHHLHRIVQHIGHTRGRRLMARLVPSAFAREAYSARTHAEQEVASSTALPIDAVAAALAGEAVHRDTEIHKRSPTLAPLLKWLRTPTRDLRRPPDTVLRQLAALFDRGDPTSIGIVREIFGDAIVRRYWVDTFPEDILTRLLYAYAPVHARFSCNLIDCLSAAWRQTAGNGHARHRQPLWHALLAFVADDTQASPLTITLALVDALTHDIPGSILDFYRLSQQHAENAAYIDVATALRLSARRYAMRTAHPSAISENAPSTPSAEIEMPSPRTVPRPTGTAMAEPDPARHNASSVVAAQAPPFSCGNRIAHARPVPAIPTAHMDKDMIYIGNAGLVIFNPFLPQFFAQLGLLRKDVNGVPRIVGTEAASRAVHLLQYLVDARCDMPEPDLPLNKLLCGLSIDTPVAATYAPSADDLAVCDEMIDAVIGNWSSIRNTSPAGLRETFLQREGRLAYRDDRWTLTIQRKTVDVLVDQIPWSHTLVKHDWMLEPLYITW